MSESTERTGTCVSEAIAHLRAALRFLERHRAAAREEEDAGRWARWITQAVTQANTETGATAGDEEETR